MAGNDEPLNVYHSRVRTHQTDLNGAMYHGAFLDTFEEARVDVFRRAGYSYDRMLEAGWYPVIRHVECDFYRPLRMDEPFQVTVTVAGLTAATLTVQYECASDGDPAALGRVVFAFLDGRHKITRVPRDLRAVIEENAGALGYRR
ncbi:MAG TPA: thioesterase family protein [Chloroflexota bacterium]|nr:thioesterase family protein [Chloroflexota bacterium]